MENTFGDSAGAKYLEDLLIKYPKDKKIVSRLLSNAFKNLNMIEGLDNYPHLSLLIVNDFTERLSNGHHEYGHEYIKSLMRNLVVAKKKVELARLKIIRLRKKSELSKFNYTIRTVRQYLTSNKLPDFTQSIKPDDSGNYLIYCMAEQIKKQKQTKNNPKQF